jgi:hypothetical protein
MSNKTKANKKKHGKNMFADFSLSAFMLTWAENKCGRGIAPAWFHQSWYSQS